MMKNIRFYNIAVLFDKQLTPEVNRCLHMDIRYSTFDIGSHMISCLREWAGHLYQTRCQSWSKIRQNLVLSTFIIHSMNVNFHLQHRRFIAEAKEKEPEVLIIGDSLIQLMAQDEVGLNRKHLY